MDKVFIVFAQSNLSNKTLILGAFDNEQSAIRSVRGHKSNPAKHRNLSNIHYQQFVPEKEEK